MSGFAKFLIVLLFPLTLAACSTTDNDRVADQNKCSSYGFEPGTDGFANCMMKRDNRRADQQTDQQKTMTWLEQQDQQAQQRRQANDDIDPRPAFDKNGNPNFDAQDNYIGCHGVGCMVDDPDNN